MSAVVDELKALIWNAIKQHVAQHHESAVTGIVTAVDTAAFTATVKVSGTESTTTTVRYINGGVTSAYVPAVNDEVVLLRTKSSLIIIGKR